MMTMTGGPVTLREIDEISDEVGYDDQEHGDEGHEKEGPASAL